MNVLSGNKKPFSYITRLSYEIERKKPKKLPRETSPDNIKSKKILNHGVPNFSGRSLQKIYDKNRDKRPTKERLHPTIKSAFWSSLYRSSCPYPMCITISQILLIHINGRETYNHETMKTSHLFSPTIIISFSFSSYPQSQPDFYQFFSRFR